MGNSQHAFALAAALELNDENMIGPIDSALATNALRHYGEYLSRCEYAVMAERAEQELLSA